MQEARVWSLGWEWSPGEGNGNPLHYSCLENPKDQGARWAEEWGGDPWWSCKESNRTEQLTLFLSLLCTRDVTILLHPPQKFYTIQMRKLRCRQLKQISPAQITSDGQSQEAYSGPLTPEHVLLRLWLTWLNSTAPVVSFTHLAVVFWRLYLVILLLPSPWCWVFQISCLIL